MATFAIAKVAMPSYDNSPLELKNAEWNKWTDTSINRNSSH